MGTAYHPQSDGKTEKVNQCLEHYLRAMLFNQQNKWASYLSLAEWWYNSTWHSVIKLITFEALYGYSPPLLALGSAPRSQVQSVNDILRDRQQCLLQLKANLQKAQERMKRNADKNHIERSFSVGDWVYLKLQPYIQLSVKGNSNQKLSSKFYGPFEILGKISALAYRLNLPPGSKLHSVFHVSQLKKKLGPHIIPSPSNPLNGPVVREELVLYLILGRRMIPRNNVAQVQLLVQWKNQSSDDATWEDYEPFAAKFSDFICVGTNLLEGEAVQRSNADLGLAVGRDGATCRAIVGSGQLNLIEWVADKWDHMKKSLPEVTKGIELSEMEETACG